MQDRTVGATQCVDGATMDVPQLEVIARCRGRIHLPRAVEDSK